MQNLKRIPPSKISHQLFSIDCFEYFALTTNDFVIVMFFDFTPNLNQVEEISGSVFERIEWMKAGVQSALAWDNWAFVKEPFALFRNR